MNEKAEKGIQSFLEGLSLNIKELNMEKTPARVASMYEELFSGIGKETTSVWGEIFATDYEGLVSALELPFYSICEHHLMPFYGSVDIVYQPRFGKVVGLSKLGALVKLLSAKPQLQERLTKEIVDAIMTDLDAEGVLVRIKAVHLCMLIRGEMQPNTNVVTMECRGSLGENTKGHEDALVMIGRT